ncbi:MAG TPA: hypothetical protein VF234_09580 [Limnochordia bacterium]
MARGFDFTRLQWKWVLASIVIFLIVQALLSVVFGVLGVLTFGIGFVLFLILKPLAYFLGGYLTAAISSGITLAEPAVGALIITLLGSAFDAPRLHAGAMLWALASSAVAFFAALVGAVFGED